MCGRGCCGVITRCCSCSLFLLAVQVVENLGLMWVGVEAPTLAGTLRVGFYFRRS